MTHPPLSVQSGDDTYRRFKLEQEGWGIVATVESQSDFERFPFMLAAAPQLLAVCQDIVADSRFVRLHTKHQQQLLAAIAKATGEEAAA